MHKLHTRDSIKQAAKDLFWEHGINHTNVNKISKAADISRMTFYREFANRDELIHEVVTDLFDEIATGMISIFEKEIPFLEKINELVYQNYKITSNISAEMLIDLNKQKNPQLKAFIDEKQNNNKKLFFDILSKEQKKGNVRNDFSVEFIAYFMDKIYELMFDKKLEEMFKSPDEIIDAITKMFFFGIVKR